MKIEDYEEVEKLIGVRERLLQASDDLQSAYESSQIRRADPGGIPGICSEGYNFCLSEYKDGSGISVDFRGCYIAVQALHALKKVLGDKLHDINDALRDRGVEVRD